MTIHLGIHLLLIALRVALGFGIWLNHKEYLQKSHVLLRHAAVRKQKKGLSQRRKDRKDENSLGKEIVDAAIGVHRELGPGLLETVYLNERLLGDLGGLARENPDSNQFMHQTA